MLADVHTATDELIIVYSLKNQCFRRGEAIENVYSMITLAAQRLQDREDFNPEGPEPR